MKAIQRVDFVYCMLWVLALVNLLYGLVLWALVFLFFDNFVLQRWWDLFVLTYTVLIPVFSFGAFVGYCLRPTRLTIILTLLGSLGTFGVWFLWKAEASRGWIH